MCSARSRESPRSCSVSRPPETAVRWYVIRVVTLALALAACSSKPSGPLPPPRDADLAWYRVVLSGPDHSEVAFLTGLPRGTDDRAVVVSGAYRTQGQVRHVASTLRVDFPIYLTSLVLEPVPDRGYRGHFEVASPAWGSGTLPLVAQPVAGPTLSALATLADGPPLDLREPRTVWQLKLGDAPTKLVLEQRAAGELEATLYFENGNIAYLGGTARGDRMLLSSFEGAGPASLDLVLDAARGAATGTWRAGHLLTWVESVTGTRTPDFELPQRIAVDGDRPVLRHPQLRDFDGKPLIVELAATWCSTCKVIAPTLREIARQHASDGLAVVSLLYELTRDPAANRAAEIRFREAHGATWDVRAVLGDQEDLVDTLPEGVANIEAGGFPVVIFRRRDGTIAGVQAGFPGPSTGAPHQAALAHLRSLTAEILKTP